MWKRAGEVLRMKMGKWNRGTRTEGGRILRKKEGQGSKVERWECGIV